MRPFKVTASAAPGVVGLGQVKATAKLAESLGFSTIVFQDHLVAQHAPIPLLTVAASVTERIRICPYVLNADFRHPAVVAQDLASLDVLSGGRLDIGVGGGWSRPEYEAIGIPFDSIGARAERVREYLRVLRGCFADEPFSHHGANYSVTSHDGQPKPVQRPHPPFLIGGGGRRMLQLAAQEANIVGFAPRLPPGRPGGMFLEPRSITVEATAEKVAWVRAAAGNRFADVELSTHSSGWEVTITNNALVEGRWIADDIARRTGVELTVEEVLQSPHVWIGTEQQLADKCFALREQLGLSTFMLGHPDRVAGIVERLAGR
jgi:probable F420-dependent oxidoreductase